MSTTELRLTPLYNSDPTPTPPSGGENKCRPRNYGLRRYIILTPPQTPPSGGAIVAALRVERWTVDEKSEYRFER